MKSGAALSDCRLYRYTLWRLWAADDRFSLHKYVMFVGLNPSTADETLDDPTIRRCVGFARQWGYDGLVMMNAFAYRSTDPKKLRSVNDPVGVDNDRFLILASKSVSKIVAAWGNHCSLSRSEHVCRLIARPIHCLGKTKSGAPKHPLYLPASTNLENFWMPGAVNKISSQG